MENKIVDKFISLKKGDTVVIYNPIDTRTKPFENTIKSIGKKWITTFGCNSNKFDPMGYGDYGWKLFPGNMEEYNQWVETKEIAKNIYNDLSSKIYRLSREELAIIKKMISE
jgi:hypothetical protein